MTNDLASRKPLNYKPAFNITEFEFENNDVWNKFKEAFDDVPVADHGSQWAHLWEKSFRPWDKGFASPSLVELLSSKTQHGSLVRGDHLSDGAPKRALVPGCGAGYDVALLGENYGFQAIGLDISPGAVATANEKHKTSSHNTHNDANGNNHSNSVGSVGFVQGDFFENGWFQSAGVSGLGQFDLIYDYTFLCALPPMLRQKWANRMAELVNPDRGHLICLEFPLGKDESLGGPPWGLKSEIYDEILGKAGMRLVVRYKPEKTHIIGEGRDMISIWAKKKEASTERNGLNGLNGHCTDR